VREGDHLKGRGDVIPLIKDNISRILTHADRSVGKGTKGFVGTRTNIHKKGGRLEGEIAYYYQRNDTSGK